MWQERLEDDTSGGHCTVSSRRAQHRKAEFGFDRRARIVHASVVSESSCARKLRDRKSSLFNAFEISGVGQTYCTSISVNDQGVQSPMRGNMAWIYRRTVVRWHRAKLLISRSTGVLAKDRRIWAQWGVIKSASQASKFREISCSWLPV